MDPIINQQTHLLLQDHEHVTLKARLHSIIIIITRDEPIGYKGKAES